MKRTLLSAFLFLVFLFLASGLFAEETKPKQKLDDILGSQNFEALSEDKKENVLKNFLLGQPELCICSTPIEVLKGDKIHEKFRRIGGFAVHCNCGEIDCALFLGIGSSGFSHNPVCFTEKQK